MIQKLICAIPPVCVSYAIEVGSGLLKDLHYLKQSLVMLGSRFALITDEQVGPLYGMPLRSALVAEGLDVSLFSIPCGEEVKSRKTKEELEDRLFENGFGRDTCILAMGGGVVTDLAGYLAGTYCRGVPFVMLPTSLLGMVDASIGGKTGVNTPHGKNLIGCICQPKKVIIDSSVLSSLSLSEMRNGVVEIIKHGLIADISLFQFLEEHSRQLLNLDPAILDRVIFESCRIKKEIVEQDEKEQGKRRLLNLGHTVGHALESLSHYAIAHGEAVAIGLLVESWLAVQMGHLQQSSFDRIRSILEAYALSLKLPARFSPSSLLNTMKLDKKSIKGRPRFVILDEIGSPLEYAGAYCTSVDETLIKDALQWMSHDLCGH
jgi:3-dehydroquinate synthase